MQLRWWVFFSLGLATASFAALYYLVVNVWPTPNTLLALPQLLFFTFMFIGLGSATIPATAYLNYRFAKSDWFERDGSRLLRQGTWVGLLGVILAYLQFIRALNLVIAVFLMAAFIIIELLFLTRD